MVATLLGMTLVLPDGAPPRFAAAMRSGSAQDLARRMSDTDSDDLPGPSEAAAELISLVARLSNHGRRTRGHSERVRAHSDVIAQQLGLDDEERQKLTWAALLHDVGKLFVPADVLNKAGRPDEAEWELIQRYPAEAVALLRPCMIGWVTGSWPPANTMNVLMVADTRMNWLVRRSCLADESSLGRRVRRDDLST